MTQFTFEAIGTQWVIDTPKELSSHEEALLLTKIKNRIDIFDKDYSRFRQDSLVTKISKESGDFTMPPDADKMLSLYKQMYDITSGLVTPLVGQVLVDTGYDENYSLVPKNPIKSPAWDEVMEWKGPILKMKKPKLLDFGAGGKGYLVDIVSEILESEGINEYCVDAGGDMRHRGEKIDVGLEHPEDIESVIGVVKLTNKSLCGSAGNRRKWADYNHVINPQTLTSPKDILAVWVTAENTLLADLLTTGLSFVSPETLQKHFKFEYLIFRHDHSIEKSNGFNAELFLG
ncbi:MAG: thiamine biosynthesis lipoprotein [Parcubacteria bacterium C7867-003]|nr:MAG: thiamine biosynthesis lipoprotein [Parcubacteria bacterium C7867-003]